MPFKDPEKRRQMSRIYGRRYIQKPAVKEKRSGYAAHRRQNSPEVYRDYWLTCNFGPGAPEHNRKQLEIQAGRCDLCEEILPVTTIDLQQDHNHATEQLRGVLCRRCNIGLHYIENITFKQAAERYLHKWNQKWASSS